MSVFTRPRKPWSILLMACIFVFDARTWGLSASAAPAASFNTRVPVFQEKALVGALSGALFRPAMGPFQSFLGLARIGAGRASAAIVLPVVVLPLALIAAVLALRQKSFPIIQQ